MSCSPASTNVFADRVCRPMVLVRAERRGSGRCVLSVAKKSKGSYLPMGARWRSTGIGSWRSSRGYLPNSRSGLNLPVLIYGITTTLPKNRARARSRSRRLRGAAESSSWRLETCVKLSYQLWCFLASSIAMGTPGSLPSQEPYQSTPVTPTGRQRAFCVSDKEVLALSISRNRGGPSQFLATLWELRELASTVVPGLSSLERSQTTRNWPERRAETKKKCSPAPSPLALG